MLQKLSLLILSYVTAEECGLPYGWTVDKNGDPINLPKREPIYDFKTDVYGHKENDYRRPWDVKFYSHALRALRHQKDMNERLRNITSDSSYVILDVRKSHEISNKIIPEMASEINLQAKYAKFEYDYVRYAPHLLFKTVDQAAGYDVSDYTCDKNQAININRDQPLLILCGNSFCGCRYMFATWYGYTNVTYVQGINSYLPGSVKNSWRGH